jgi:hypothetical protein
VIRETDHGIILKKPGVFNHVNVPKHKKELSSSIIRDLLNDAGIKREQYLKLLDKIKK